MLAIIRKHGVCIRLETEKKISYLYCAECMEEGFSEAFLKELVQLRDEICANLNQLILEHNKRCPLHRRFSTMGMYLDAPENQQSLIKEAQAFALLISDAMDDGSITNGKTAWAKILSRLELSNGTFLKYSTWQKYLQMFIFVYIVMKE
ncbi:MAG: hypothetical protein ACRDD6_15200 [Tannerellaceae bacterium]